MAVTSINVTLGATATQITTTVTKARWIAFSDLAAAVMKIGDANVSATRGIPLAAAGAAGSVFLVPPVADSGQYSDLSQWWAFGTTGNVLTVVYDSVNF